MFTGSPASNPNFQPFWDKIWTMMDPYLKNGGVWLVNQPVKNGSWTSRGFTAAMLNKGPLPSSPGAPFRMKGTWWKNDQQFHLPNPLKASNREAGQTQGKWSYNFLNQIFVRAFWRKNSLTFHSPPLGGKSWNPNPTGKKNWSHMDLPSHPCGTWCGKTLIPNWVQVISTNSTNKINMEARPTLLR